MKLACSGRGRKQPRNPPAVQTNAALAVVQLKTRSFAPVRPIYRTPDTQNAAFLSVSTRKASALTHTGGTRVHGWGGAPFFRGEWGGEMEQPDL